MIDTIKDFWGIAAGTVGALVWLLRLEGKVGLNAAAIARLEQQRHEDLVSARETRAATNDALREVKADLSDIRADIKQLLRASAK